MEGCTVIGYYRSSVPSLALAFGDGFSLSRQGRVLAELYPEAIHYNIFRQRFESWSSSSRETAVRHLVEQGRCVLLQGDIRNIDRLAGFEAKEVAVRGNEGLYRLTLNSSAASLIAEPEFRESSGR